MSNERSPSPRRKGVDSRPKVVYLDQFAFSNAYAAEKKGLRSDWLDLAEAIKRARDRGTVICPTSQFHEQESALHPEAELLLSFARELSRKPGRVPIVRRFRDKWDLLTLCALPVLHLELGLPPPPKPLPWLDVRWLFLPPLIQDRRWLKAERESKQQAGELLRANAGGKWSRPGASYKTALSSEMGEREELALRCFLGHWLGRITHEPPGRFFVACLLQAISSVDGFDIERNVQRLRDFFASSAYRALPIPALESGLWAAARDGSNKKSHSITENDLLDFEMLAHLGPFVDVIVVDKRTANLARQPRVRLRSLLPELRLVTGAQEVRALTDELRQM